MAADPGGSYLCGTQYEQDLDSLSGEFRDPINYNAAVGAAVIGGIWLAIVSPLMSVRGIPVGLIVFMLLFPLACAAAVLIALTTATMTYDRSGWTFTRKLFGYVREQDGGSWNEVAATNYLQWYVPGGRGGGGTLYGELQVLDARGAIVLRARTAFWVQGNPTARHSAGKRQIGLQPDQFDQFVRLIDRETRHLDYVWTRADVDPDAKFGGFMQRPGPPHYVRVGRGMETASSDEFAVDDAPAEDPGFHPPIWRCEVSSPH